jgi:RHS repeat-associated protein
MAVVAITLVLISEAGAVVPASSVSAARIPIADAHPTLAPEEPQSPTELVAQPTLAPQEPQSPTELVALRTATSRTVDNHDGTLTAELYSQPIHYQPDADRWEPIQISFADSAKPDLRAESAKAPVAVRLPKEPAVDGLVSLASAEHDIAFRLVDAGPGGGAEPMPDPPTPDIDGGVATYADLLPGIDLQVHARAYGVKTFVVLKDEATARTSFTFAVDAPRLTLETARDGGAQLVDAAGAIVAIVPYPYAVDSSVNLERGGGAYADAVNLSVGDRDGQPTLTLSVDPDWLASAVFPVYLDPSLTFLTGSDAYGDAFVSQAYPTQNFADYVRPTSPYYHELWLGMDPANSNNVNNVLLKFDLATIAEATIESASLSIYGYHQYYNAPTATTTWVNRVTSANWTESGVTWNNQPGSVAVTSGGTVEGQPASFTVTATVQGWVAAPTSNYGFKLHENGNGATYWKRLMASENGSCCDPELAVTYHRPVATPAATNWTASRTRTWTYSDPQGHAQSHYRVEVATSSSFGTILSSSGVLAGAATSWAIPGGVSLTNGTEYWYRVKVKDGSGWSDWGVSTFLWDTATPSFVSVTVGGAVTAADPDYFDLGNGTFTVKIRGSDANSGIQFTNLRLYNATDEMRVKHDWSVGGTNCNEFDTSTLVDATACAETYNAGGTREVEFTVAGLNQSASFDIHYFFTDYAGNTLGYTDTGKNLIFDATPPSAAITSPESNTTASGTVTVSGTASDANFTQYELQYGVGVAPGSWSSIGTNPRTTPVTSGTLGSWDTSALADGAYTLRLRVYDKARVSSGFSEVLRTVTVGANLGRQRQHTFESWGLGAGDELAVNVFSGNLVVSHPLVTLPYRGGSLGLTLTYNSQDAANVGLSPGWRLDLMRRLTLNADATVTFTDADGARHTFTNPVVNGSLTTYTRPAGLYAILVKDTSLANEFTLTYRDQGRDLFDISGSEALLKRAEDRHANGLDLAYATGTNISTVTDPAGRQLTFGWNTTPSPDLLTSITDWAYVSGGIVQTTATGSQRSYRFFYSSDILAGWSDPVNTSGSCPTGGSHLTCLVYSTGELTEISKTQTFETLSGGALGTDSRIVITPIAYAGRRVSSVTDAEQNAQEGPATSFTLESATRLVVDRPTTSTAYDLVAVGDVNGRVGSVWRYLDETTAIERRTTWDTTYPTEPATVTDNYGAILNAPARTLTYTYVASSLGNLAKLVEPLTASPATNRWTEYTYNANNDVTEVKVSLDGSASERTITRFCYNTTASCPSASGLDLLAQIENYVDGVGGTGAGLDDNDTDVRTEYTYDSYGQRTSSTRHNRDASGVVLDDRVDSFAFDANGNLTAEIVNYANGTVTSPGDDITPNATTLARTDLTTVHTYDTAGNRVSSADPRRAILAATGSPGIDDYVTRWEYDAVNLQISETTPTTPGLASTQRTASSTYDELGGLRRATDFGGLITATEFDSAGRTLRSFEDPDPGAASVTAILTYDPDGRLTTGKDRRQAADSSLGVTTYAYDGLGRQSSVVSADGSASEAQDDTTYDGLDRRTSLEIGAGSASSLLTNYVYDLGERVIETDDGFACATGGFDYRDLLSVTTGGLAGGTCATATDTRELTHTHDGLGRLARSEVTDGADLGDRTVDDVFDAVGNRRSAAVRVDSVTSTTTFGVNLLDQVSTEARPDGSTAKTAFDPGANPSDRCYWKPSIAVGACNPVGTTPWSDPPTQVTTTLHDARNQRVSLTDAAAGSTTTYDPDENYAIDALYRATASGREHQALYTYDSRHRLTDITFQTCTADASHVCTDTEVSNGSDTYSYDDNDNRTQVVEHNGSGSTDRRYCYNARNQLVYRNTGAACSSGSNDETWTYDDAGNRLTATSAGTTTNFAYYATGQLCDLEVGSAANCSGGNVSSDTAGRIESWNGWTFAYDAEARLISACKSTTCASGYDKVEFSYDGEGHRTKIVATAAGGTVTTTEFRYQGDAVVEEKVNGTVVRQFVTDESGAISKLIIPAGLTDAGTYLVSWNGHGDALNLLRVNGDGTTTLANSFTYDTWGKPTIATHNGIGDLGFRYLYVGRFDVQWDDQFGLQLHYMHARHYATGLALFLQPDPPALEDNLFAYVSNNPVTTVDPTGTKELRGPGGAGGGGGGRGGGGYVTGGWRGAALNRLLLRGIRQGMCTTAVRGAILASGFVLVGHALWGRGYVYGDGKGAQVRMMRNELGQWRMTMQAPGGNYVDPSGRGNQPRSSTHVNLKVC